jgi:adenylylsulfate kinase
VAPVREGIFREYLGRSMVKAVSYRVIVVVADFAAVYLFTGRVEIALGFVVVSNIYTTGLYFLHERFWDRVTWGRGVG